MEIGHTIGSSRVVAPILVIIRQAVGRTTEDETVVRVPGEEQFDVTVGGDGVDADIAIIVGPKENGDVLAGRVHGVLASVRPHIDMQADIVTMDGTEIRESLAVRGGPKHGQQRQTDGDDEKNAFHGLPPFGIQMTNIRDRDVGRG
jgi:hypothetical protein